MDGMFYFETVSLLIHNEDVYNIVLPTYNESMNILAQF